ncbi:MAG TPA: cbb3-type cytochrome c oxidase N-terminal domain-containing protein [Opitutaceae bacterium]|nr:cbb3-type cytochrome c oxidase N-terminal domain-containing protein [Opitutaceae bacterium]HND63067.1 cbb3-type cytochrome c oxidase N-terminal domain-containing protein [Opitutaceae bacterium]
MTPTPNPTPHDQDQLRPHVFDGDIQEYDKRLPNWWLVTLYATMVFWVGYWFYYERAHLGPTNAAAVEQQLAVIEAKRLASTPNLDDASLWQMSKNPVFVEAGRATFNSTCASCHTDKLTGAIGPNLVDHLWIHGGKPTQVLQTVTNGVLAKGMPPWGPVLGPKKISEVVAYVLSYHQEGEPIEVQDVWVPITPK